MNLEAQGEDADLVRHLEPSALLTQRARSLPRWIGWRLRLLVVAMLCMCGLLFVGSYWLSQQPHAPWTWQATSTGGVRLVATDDAALLPYIGWDVQALQAAGMPQVPVHAILLEPSMRWLVHPQELQAFREQHEGLSRLRANWPAGPTSFDMILNSPQHHVAVATSALKPKGWMGLGWQYGVLSLLALAVAGVGFVVLLAGVQWRNAAFLIMALGQAGHLYLMAFTGSLGPWAPWHFLQWEAALRTGLDLATVAALIQVAAWHPRRMPHAHWISAGGWLLAIGLGTAGWMLARPAGWWLTQASCLLLGGIAVALMDKSQQQTPHPITLMIRRLSIITLLIWATLTVAIGLTHAHIDLRLDVTRYGILVWHVFFTSQLLLTPYLSASRPVLQEFSLLAASSTVASALDLFFVAVFSLGPFASMALSLFLALGVYVLVRRWIVTHVLQRDPITTERLFERLYRMARDLERRPDQLEKEMQGLFRELFDPLEISWLNAPVSESQIKGHGGMLLVPMPILGNQLGKQSFLLQHANKGRRLFTDEDARLADRVVDQIDRALRYDRAVEQGRSEERMRLAQDLHDDIGARLLTLMYQAPNPSIEEYIRHMY